MIAKVDFRVFLISVEGRLMRVGIFDGRRDYSNIPGPELDGLVGGPKLIIVQVNRPTNGFEGRSSLGLTKVIAPKADSIIYWAKNTETFRSIVEELSKAGEEL